ncbi:MAG: C10 family peptidase [Candidatus Thermoplasmatota archaeon]|nr:C10 family peptidase [Candidatus Thermoplasmatota archaeon]
MLRASHTKKTGVFITLTILLLAIFIPTIYGNETRIASDKKNKTTSITINIATTVAITKLCELNKKDFSIHHSQQINDEKQKPLFYVFELHPQGYLIVTGSFDLPPVIAYSFTNNYLDDTNRNPLFDLLYADVTFRLKNIQLVPDNILEERHLQWDSYLKGNPIDTSRFEQWPPEGTTPTGGWLLTNWNQNAPYNNFCPLDISHGGSRSVAGCPAVAMAQIFNYHNTTMNVTFDNTDDYYHNYGGNQYWIDNDYTTYGFPTFPMLNTYLSTLQSHYMNQIPLTNDDKAAITFACGVAATQVYASGGSGTFGVNQAYDAYQRFGCTTIELLDENDPELYDRLLNNMKDAIPAHLAIVNEQWTAGHNVVVDGYNTNDFYHINFGWGGSYNGWYLIPDELPYSLTVIEGVIVDILKNTAVPDLTCDGELEWINVTPNVTVTSSFTVRNIGEAGSYLDWEIIDWPSWGEWTCTPSDGNNLKPEDGLETINVEVVVPNIENHLFTGQIKVVNRENSTDYDIIPVTLQTSIKIHEKVSCNGSFSWTDVKPGSTLLGEFTVENIGAAHSNLSWEISDWPDWGTWTFSPTEGTGLTPEDAPVIISVSLVAPKKKSSDFNGQITVVNTQNSSDYDTVPITMTTPYQSHFTFFDMFHALLSRFPRAFPILRLILSS